MIGQGELRDTLEIVLPGHSWVATCAWCVMLTILSGWYSGLETGVYRFNRLRGKLLARTGDRVAAKLGRFLQDQRLLICMILIGNNLWNYLAASVLTTYFDSQGRSSGQAELLTTAILTPILFVFGETIPKNWFYNRPNTLVLRSGRLLAWNYWLITVTGIGYVLRLLTNLTLRLANLLGPAKHDETDTDDLTYLLRESHAAGAISAVQTDIAERILELPELNVSRVMIPLGRVIALPIETGREEFIRTAREHPIARIPLYTETKGNITGAVSTDRLLAEADCQPREVIEPVLKVSAGASVLSALNAMQQHVARMAIIVGRDDQAVGIVTISGLVKHLLGQ